MTDDELLQLIAVQEKASLGSSESPGATVGSTYYSSTSTMTTLEIDRFNALNFYFARPLGNEIENSSSVVLPELRDTVEWIMPQLMRIFAAAHTPCVFDPEGAEDVEQAALETEAVRHVFMSQNEGFFVLHDLCKDALLLRNGYVKVYWEDRTTSNVERYSGLTEMEVSTLLSDKADETVEILSQREYQVDMPPQANPQPTGQQGPQMPGGQPAPAMAIPAVATTMSAAVTVFDLEIRRTKKCGRVCVECVPPEEMLVSPKARTNLDAAPFSCHKTLKTRSELISDGYDRDVIDSLTPGKPRWLEMDALARDVVVDQMSVEQGATDKAMQDIEVRDVAIKVDYDGDGIAELRRVLVAGDKIIENEEIPEVPFASAVPKRMPHRHTGISLYDELADIQVIKSELVRQGLNNLRLAQNGRVAVDWTKCNLSDLMDSRAGGIVRTNGPPANILMPFQHPSNLMEQVVPMMQYVDTWREFRTGVGKDTVGIDADALQNVTKGGQLAGMAAAGLKIEMIARCLAEGIKDVFLKIRALMVRHQNQAMQFQMAGKWVTVDPTQWRDRTRVSANVGLGSGTREEARANLLLLGQMQEKLAPMGLIAPQHAYATFKTGVPLLGFEHPEQFAFDPASDEYKQWVAQHPPQPNPAVVAAQTRLQATQVQAQAGVQKAQIAEQAASQRAQAEVVHSAIQSKEDRMVNLAGLDMQAFLAIAKIIAPIVAAQLKQDPSVNAGQVLREDIAGLEGAQ